MTPKRVTRKALMKAFATIHAYTDQQKREDIEYVLYYREGGAADTIPKSISASPITVAAVLIDLAAMFPHSAAYARLMERETLIPIAVKETGE